ncbi:unnamed protein product [marine sediment metagenome]|uniref:Uncharacterized protein n=1 Tax=marine sediment metagenome TaxID=412755 RepID=X1QPU2_9ZZZZ
MTTIKELKEEAYKKAIDSLARYKFMMFGYWAAIWVYLNQIDAEKENNPFKGLVEKARQIQHSDRQR